MKTSMLIAVGAISLGGASLAPMWTARAYDCGHGHRGCAGLGAPADAVRGPQTGSMYDPDTVTTVRGTVGAVTLLPARGRRMGGMHVTVEGDGRTMDVHLGPSWYLEREGVELAKGDSVEVTGSVVESDGATFLIARELKRGEKVFKLRDERGVPRWAGGPRPR